MPQTSGSIELETRRTRWNRWRRLSMVLAIGFALSAGVDVAGLRPIGIVHATSPSQQNGEEESAGPLAASDKPSTQGTESLSDLLEGQPVTKDLIQALTRERRSIETRTKELDRREKELAIVAGDIDQKLERLEKLRKELDDLYRRIAEAQDKEVAEAVKRFRAMDSALAAKVFNQMDLEYVARVLKRMDPQTAGSILNAMVEDAEQGTDATEKENKIANLRKLGENLVGSGKGFAETAP